MLAALAIVAFGLTSPAISGGSAVFVMNGSKDNNLPPGAAHAATAQLIASQCGSIVRFKKQKSQAYFDGMRELNSLDADGKRVYANWKLHYQKNKQRLCQIVKQQLEKGYDMPDIELRK